MCWLYSVVFTGLGGTVHFLRTSRALSYDRQQQCDRRELIGRDKEATSTFHSHVKNDGRTIFSGFYVQYYREETDQHYCSVRWERTEKYCWGAGFGKDEKDVKERNERARDEAPSRIPDN